MSRLELYIRFDDSIPWWDSSIISISNIRMMFSEKKKKDMDDYSEV